MSIIGTTQKFSSLPETPTVDDAAEPNSYRLVAGADQTISAYDAAGSSRLSTGIEDLTDRPLVEIRPNGRLLLTLRYVDGRIVADYDPADLDEAARAFIDAVLARAKAITEQPRPRGES